MLSRSITHPLKYSSPFLVKFAGCRFSSIHENNPFDYAIKKFLGENASKIENFPKESKGIMENKEIR